MGSSYWNAVGQNASTGGLSGGYVKVGAGYESSGRGGGPTKEQPYGHQVQGNKLYYATAYGLSEATSESKAAGRLMNQLKQLPLATPEQREKRDNDFGMLERKMRDGSLFGPEGAVLLDAVRARYGFTG